LAKKVGEIVIVLIFISHCDPIARALHKSLKCLKNSVYFTSKQSWRCRHRLGALSEVLKVHINGFTLTLATTWPRAGG